MNESPLETVLSSISNVADAAIKLKNVFEEIDNDKILFQHEKKIRLIEAKSFITGTQYWYIEKKNWFRGWYQPDLTYARSATFYNKSEALRWYVVLLKHCVLKNGSNII